MSKANNYKRVMSNRDIAIIIIAAFLMTTAAFIQYFYMRNSIINAAAKLHDSFHIAKRFQLFFRNIFCGDRKPVLYGSLL